MLVDFRPVRNLCFMCSPPGRNTHNGAASGIFLARETEGFASFSPSPNSQSRNCFYRLYLFFPIEVLLVRRKGWADGQPEGVEN